MRLMAIRDKPTFVIRLGGGGHARFVYTARTYVRSVEVARKFSSRKNAALYIKKHTELAEANAEIIQLSLLWKTY